MSSSLAQLPGPAIFCRTLQVANEAGLHLRPAALLVTVALRFDAEVVLHRGDRAVSCKSLLDLVSLCAECGAEVTLAAKGPDASEAMEAIASLFARAFNERRAPTGDGQAAHRAGLASTGKAASSP